jgi:hypothetical protein
MVQKTISRLYDRYQDATETVRDLEKAGIPYADISLLGPTDSSRGMRPTGDLNTHTHSDAVTGASAGATVGSVIGGGAGLLAGLGSLAIPGIGPIVAAGWLVATAAGAGAGAAAGGLLGALTGAGVEESDAHTYAEGVRRGGSLVSVRVIDENRLPEVEAIMDRRTPVDPNVRRADYSKGGWTKFDMEAGPYSTTEAVDLPENKAQRDRMQVP